MYSYMYVVAHNTGNVSYCILCDYQVNAKITQPKLTKHYVCMRH